MSIRRLEAFEKLDRIDRIFRISVSPFPDERNKGRHEAPGSIAGVKGHLKHGDGRPAPFRFASGKAKNHPVRHARRRLAGPILSIL